MGRMSTGRGDSWDHSDRSRMGPTTEQCQEAHRISNIMRQIEFEDARACYNKKCKNIEKGMTYKDGTKWYCDAEYETFEKCDSRIPSINTK
jgi:hypothetical protein